jgi:hypothetical protein
MTVISVYCGRGLEQRAVDRVIIRCIIRCPVPSAAAKLSENEQVA